MLNRSGTPSSDYRHAMRQMAGGVSIVTVGAGDDVAGFTATSVVSVSAEPPALLFSINRETQSYGVLQRRRIFAVNILAASQQAVAEAFSGRSGERGTAKFAHGTWSTMTTGAPTLAGAIATLDCDVDEIIERASNAIVIGLVRSVRMCADPAAESALAYWRGAYHRVASGGA